MRRRGERTLIGGLVALVTRPADVCGRGTLDRVVDHLEHMVETAGVDHVGLGPDFLREYMDAIYPQYDEFRRFGAST